MFETGNPYAGRELRASLGQLVSEGRAQLGALPLELFFAPQGDRWSPAEHIRHLRKTTAPVGMALRLPRWVLLLRFGMVRTVSRDLYLLRDDYRKKLAEGGQAGSFAPSVEAPPNDPIRRRTEILEAWSDSAQKVDAAIVGWTEPALDRAYLPHPLLGPLTVREMIEFTVYHTSHHLTLIMSRVAPAA